MAAYKNIAGPNGTQDNIGGTTQRVYFAPISAFDSIAAAVDLGSETNMAELSEISTDHTFTGTKGFFKSYCTRDKGNVKGTIVGERDGRGMKFDGMFFVPGSVIATLGGTRKMKNDQFVFLFEQADGTLLQIGTERFPAEVSIEYDTAQNESGVRGTTFKVSGFESGPFIYTGAITLDTTP